jgi:hypothetical protein
MNETNSQRKNKICLSDYNYHKDIENRLLMSRFSISDLEVLEEILFSPLQISLKKLAKNIDVTGEKIGPILEKLKTTGLLTYEGDTITVDKEMRKYFETQMMLFEENTYPGMEYFQALLRKVPIHTLPIWYSIPRSSNNIFESLIERYLLTPNVFQRYLQELNLGDPHLVGILHDVYNAPDFKLSSKELMKKYALTKEQFEEAMLLLEFNIVCTLSYEKLDGEWKEIVTPFYEWREYLRFQRDTETPPLSSPATVKRTRPADFAFVEDMGNLLNLIKKTPLPVSRKGEFSKAALELLATVCKDYPPGYLEQVLAKLSALKLTEVIQDKIYALEGSNEWHDLSLEDRALSLHRHPLNRLVSKEFPAHIAHERTIREAEKSIVRVLDRGWVYFDDFVKGVMVAFDEQSSTMLKRVGKTWKYTLPNYTEEELAFIKAVIFEWLFETGIVATGTHQGKDCFCTTAFGQSFFGR